MKSIKTLNDPINIVLNSNALTHVLRRITITESECQSFVASAPLWLFLITAIHGERTIVVSKTIEKIVDTRTFDSTKWIKACTNINNIDGIVDSVIKEMGDETLVDCMNYFLYSCNQKSHDQMLPDGDFFENWENVRLLHKIGVDPELSARGLDKLIVMSEFTTSMNTGVSNLTELLVKRDFIFAISKEMNKRKLQSVIELDTENFVNLYFYLLSKGDERSIHVSGGKDTFAMFPILFQTFVDYKNNPQEMGNVIDKLMIKISQAVKSSSYKIGYSEKTCLEKMIDLYQNSWVTVKKEKNPELTKQFVEQIDVMFKKMEKLMDSSSHHSQGIVNSLRASMDKIEVYFLREKEKNEILGTVKKLNRSSEKDSFELDNPIDSITIKFDGEKWREFQKIKNKKTIAGGVDTKLNDSLSKIQFGGLLNIDTAFFISKFKQVEVLELGESTKKMQHDVHVVVKNIKNEDPLVFKDIVNKALKLFLLKDHKDFDAAAYMKEEDKMLMLMDIVDKPLKRSKGVKF